MIQLPYVMPEDPYHCTYNYTIVDDDDAYQRAGDEEKES